MINAIKNGSRFFSKVFFLTKKHLNSIRDTFKVDGKINNQIEVNLMSQELIMYNDLSLNTFLTRQLDNNKMIHEAALMTNSIPKILDNVRINMNDKVTITGSTQFNNSTSNRIIML